MLRSTTILIIATFKVVILSVTLSHEAVLSAAYGQAMVLSAAYDQAMVLSSAYGQSSPQNLHYRGQTSGWLNINPGNELPLYTGIRYIPQVNYNLPPAGSNQFDLELSANIFGSAGINPFSEFTTEGKVKPYRSWLRYSANQFEVRAGLQKINFGSATMIRPLMWFDQVDPRDPLQLTDGVWGVLGRYYFLNNVNIWLWGLYGNTQIRMWESGTTAKNRPEAGGRFQLPLSRGEMAFTYHHRQANIANTGQPQPGGSVTPENRYGFDIRVDVEIGLWLEAALIKQGADNLTLPNQHLLTAGADYTFAVGNGLTLTAEHSVISHDAETFKLKDETHFTAASVIYPLGILDNINAIVYREWTNNKYYTFISWQRQYDNLSLYLMGYINPGSEGFPHTSESTGLFAGRGFQVMLIYNH